MNDPVLAVRNNHDPVVEAVAVDGPPRWWERRSQRLLLRYESGRVAVVEQLGSIWVELASVETR